MLNHKNTIKRFVFFLRENWIVLLFGLITTLSGFLIIGNVYSNFKYFLDHRFFITLSNGFSELFTVIKSIFYNNIIQGSSESLTSLFNLKNVYGGLVGGEGAGGANSFLNYILLAASIFVFVLVGLSSYIITFINTKRESLRVVFKEIKNKFPRLFLIDLIRVLCFSLVFIILSFVAYIFKLNSYLYIIIGFSVSFLFLFLFYFIYQFSLRGVLFYNLKISESIKDSFFLIRNNKKGIILNSFILFIFVFLFLISITIIVLPLLLLNNYFVSVGYNIFNLVGSVFYILINIITTTLINIFIIRFINDLYFDCKK